MLKVQVEDPGMKSGPWRRIQEHGIWTSGPRWIPVGIGRAEQEESVRPVMAVPFESCRQIRCSCSLRLSGGFRSGFDHTQSRKSNTWFQLLSCRRYRWSHSRRSTSVPETRGRAIYNLCTRRGHYPWYWRQEGVAVDGRRRFCGRCDATVRVTGMDKLPLLNVTFIEPL